MSKIQMIDLKGQYDKIADQIDHKIIEIVRSSAFINGPEVHAFQKELENYLEVSHVIPCANGTDALQVSMMGLGLQPGDEVITTDFSFVSAVESISLLKLTPVLVDVDPNSFNIDVESIKRAISPKTKAIIPVHLFGQCADMQPIIEIAEQYDLFVIEDTAQALGAKYHFKNGDSKKAGTMGDIGITSFFPSKNLGCYGDGGAIFTNNDDLAHTLRGLVQHGMYKRYYYDTIGINTRLDSIQAGVLRIKLPYLEEYINRRRKAAKFYDQAFVDTPNIQTPSIASFSSHTYNQYTIKILNGKRNQLHQHLKEKNIPSTIYYPVPLHSQKAYWNAHYNEHHFSVSNVLKNQVLSLPIHTELTISQLKEITNAVNEFMHDID